MFKTFFPFVDLFVYNTSGIYAIINKKTGQTYIGETGISLLYRSSNNLQALRYNSHHNKKLQKDWNKYGGENFKLVIIFQNIPDDLKRNAEEQRTIDEIPEPLRYNYDTSTAPSIIEVTYNDKVFRNLELLRQEINELNLTNISETHFRRLIKENKIPGISECVKKSNTKEIMVGTETFVSAYAVVQAGYAKNENIVRHNIRNKEKPDWRYKHPSKNKKYRVIWVNDKPFIGIKNIVDAGLAKNRDQVYRNLKNKKPGWVRDENKND